MDDSVRRAEELLRLAGQRPLVMESKDPNARLIDDFVSGTGAFSDPGTLIDPQDLSALRYYRGASREILQRATTEDCVEEKTRLIAVAETHLRRIDRILSRYSV